MREPRPGKHSSTRVDPKAAPCRPHRSFFRARGGKSTLLKVDCAVICSHDNAAFLRSNYHEAQAIFIGFRGPKPYSTYMDGGPSTGNPAFQRILPAKLDECDVCIRHAWGGLHGGLKRVRLFGVILGCPIFSTRQPAVFGGMLAMASRKARAWSSVFEVGKLDAAIGGYQAEIVLLEVVELKVLYLCIGEIDLGNFRHVFAHRVPQNCGQVAGEGIALGQRIQVPARAYGADDRGVIDRTSWMKDCAGLDARRDEDGRNPNPELVELEAILSW